MTEKRKMREAWKRAMRGALPRSQMVGQNHPCWAGGQYCFCKVCGKSLGWRSPSKIGPNGTYCREHKNAWRQAPADAKNADSR